MRPPRLRTCENDAVSGIVTPHVYELNHVTEPQTGMSTEYNTGLKVLRENSRGTNFNEIPLGNPC